MNQDLKVNSESLHVFWDERLVGRIRKEGQFSLVFQYDKAWLDDYSAPAVSVALPKDNRPKVSLATAHFSNLGPKTRPATAFFSNARPFTFPRKENIK
jgi:HipA-like protein